MSSTTATGVLREDLLQAVAYCRLGGARPSNDLAFEEAKRLGLLAQDPVWRATPQGEGALIAAGRLDGAPAPQRQSVAIRWAVCERYPQPQLVAVWPEYTYETLDQAEVDRTDREFCDYDEIGSRNDWQFWTTFADLSRPPVPAADDEDAWTA